MSRDFRLDADPKMEPSHMTGEEAFTTTDKTELIHEHFNSADGKLMVGTWECAPCREEIEAYPVNEMMVVVSGVLNLTHPGGRTETFTKGDTFFIAKGDKVVWEITETLRKFYMIQE